MLFNQVCYSASLMLTPQGLLRLMSLHLLKHSLFLIILVFISGNVWKSSQWLRLYLQVESDLFKHSSPAEPCTQQHPRAPHQAVSMLARTWTAETVTTEFASLSGCCCLSFYWPSGSRSRHTLRSTGCGESRFASLSFLLQINWTLQNSAFDIGSEGNWLLNRDILYRTCLQLCCKWAAWDPNMPLTALLILVCFFLFLMMHFYRVVPGKCLENSLFHTWVKPFWLTFHYQMPPPSRLASTGLLKSLFTSSQMHKMSPFLSPNQISPPLSDVLSFLLLSYVDSDVALQIPTSHI